MLFLVADLILHLLLRYELVIQHVIMPKWLYIEKQKNKQAGYLTNAVTMFYL